MIWSVQRQISPVLSTAGGSKSGQVYAPAAGLCSELLLAFVLGACSGTGYSSPVASIGL